MTRGKLISFEGPEGSGKTTQAQILKDKLTQMGYDVIYSREPGGTRTGEMIRDILKHNIAGEAIDCRAEALLFAACRAQLVNHVIKPALERGEWVIVDRFADSTTAYQGYGRGLPIEELLAINSFALGGLEPDLTILLDVKVEQGFSRVTKRSEEKGCEQDRIEQEARSFHERVRSGYLKLAERCPKRFRIVNGSGNTDEVAQNVVSIIQREL